MSITEDWTPVYAPWRHGGWYVTNVRYPSGAVGCVSNNYSDRAWRIVTEGTGPGSEGDRTFKSRNAAARAERLRAEGRCAFCGLAGDGALFEPFNRAGSLACRAIAACGVRQRDDSAVRCLGALLRAVRHAELARLTTAELASLAVDLDGYTVDVHIHLSSRGDSATALAAERADRKARKANRP
jgi:hypothetical protein